MNRLFLFLALTRIAFHGFAQDTPADWQKLAIQKYPSLGIPGSPAVRKYNELYSQKRRTEPEFFQRSNWPMVLAQQATLETGLKQQQASLSALPTPPLRAPDAPGIRLTGLWWSRTGTSSGGGSQTLADVKYVLVGVGRPIPSVEPFPDEPVYKGVHYLEPLSAARERLSLKSLAGSKTKVSCPGFPEALYYHSWDTGEAFNRLYIVTDAADQVVSVQRVSETPHATDETVGGFMHTYNFVNLRCKATPKQRVLLRVDGKSSRDATCIATALVEGPRCLERCEWYVPTPLANLILYCVAQNQVVSNQR